MKYSEIKVGQKFCAMDENSVGTVVEVEPLAIIGTNRTVITVQLDDPLGTYFWGNPDDEVSDNFQEVK